MGGEGRRAQRGRREGGTYFIGDRRKTSLAPLLDQRHRDLREVRLLLHPVSAAWEWEGGTYVHDSEDGGDRTRRGRMLGVDRVDGVQAGGRKKLARALSSAHGVDEGDGESGASGEHEGRESVVGAEGRSGRVRYGRKGPARPEQQ